ncbi:MAG: DNA translocase FtsK [Acidobacteria bacterium]|nr:DNA translocase FtsK [Acidobacteriota bacterium]
MLDESSAKKHESIGVILLLAALLIFLSLVSYSPGDPSTNTLSIKPTAENKVGRLGAFISDLLYQVFGFAAFLLLIPLLIVGWKLILGWRIDAKYLKAGGFLLLLSASASALQLVPLVRENPAFMPGGATGVMLSEFLLLNLNYAGTVIVIIGALILGVLATTPWSLSRGFSRFSSIPSQDPPRTGLKERFRLWREKRKARHAPTVSIKPATVFMPGLQLNHAPAKPSPSLESVIPVLSQAEGKQEVETASGAADKSQADLPPADLPRDYELPSIYLLNAGEDSLPVNETELRERAKILEDKCAEFDANGNITQIHPGPVVTTFEFKPDPGVKYSRITGLVDDLCLGIKAESLRIDRIPGKATIGIEVPNPRRETIMLRDLIESDVFANSRSKLTLALGKMINGTPYVTDLAKMPHLLIAGSTGAGKSVGLNCMITSILYKATPEEVRFIFIDPKCVELGIYTDIPHLLTPIVTDPGEAANALRWATNEMEIRYKKLARRSVRNIEQYNAILRSGTQQNDEREDEPEKPLPYLVLVIDELADLMMVSSKEVEASISRLTAKARAVGIHLILATQRPSVDVITGVIKSNLPSRIAFKVASKVDSRTIIDGNGAEQLLGNGDMLFIPPGTARLIRVHGAYLSEKETQDIVEHLKAQGRPAYDDSVLCYGAEAADESGNSTDADATDSLYNDAVRVVVNEGRASTSLLQRRLSIGYGRAAKLIDMMHNNGIVGPADGARPREVLAGLDFLERLSG